MNPDQDKHSVGPELGPNWSHLGYQQMTLVATSKRRNISKSTKLCLEISVLDITYQSVSKYTSTTTSKAWPSIYSMHLPLQSRLKAFGGSV